MCCIMGGMGMMMMMDAAAAAKKRLEEVNPGWTTSHYLQWKIDSNILFFYFCHSTHRQSVSIYDTNLSSLSSLTRNPTHPPQQICFSFGKKFSSGFIKKQIDLILRFRYLCEAPLTHWFMHECSIVTIMSAAVCCRCVVCLGDYQKNETLQQLPVCSHIFHKACVDEWLANNSTCPLCRMSLLLFPTQKNSNNNDNNIIMKSSSSSSPPQPSSQLQQLPRLISNRNSAAAHEERISTFPTPSTIWFPSSWWWCRNEVSPKLVHPWKLADGTQANMNVL